MPHLVLQALGFKIYRIPGFHEWAAVAAEAGSVFLRDGLAVGEEEELLFKALDVLMLPRAEAAAG